MSKSCPKCGEPLISSGNIFNRTYVCFYCGYSVRKALFLEYEQPVYVYNVSYEKIDFRYGIKNQEELDYINDAHPDSKITLIEKYKDYEKS